MEVLKHVDIGSLVKLDISFPKAPFIPPGTVMVNVEAIEEGKQVIIDSDALSHFNQVLTHKCKELNVKDPRTKRYISEFTERMLNEWHQHGLLVIEDIPEAEDDPYKHLR